MRSGTYQQLMATPHLYEMLRPLRRDSGGRAPQLSDDYAHAMMPECRPSHHQIFGDIVPLPGSNPGEDDVGELHLHDRRQTRSGRATPSGSRRGGRRFSHKEWCKS